MITKADLKVGDLDSIMGYYDSIVQSMLHGNKHRAIRMIADLSTPQAVDFLNYLSDHHTIHNEFLIKETWKRLKHK